MNSLVDRLSRALYITNRNERTNVSRERLAYSKIIDHTNSREDTWPDLPQYLVISDDLPGARVISILDPKNSGVSYGFS